MKTTKFYYLIALLLLGTSFVNAQEENEPQYLIGNQTGKVYVSGFGSYTIGFSEFDGDLAVYNGGSGAILLNQTVYFGGYGTGLSTSHRRDDITIQTAGGNEFAYSDLKTMFGHGGFIIGYIHKSYKPVHFGASTKLGWGAASLIEDNNYDYHDSYNYNNVVTDQVFVITPQVEVELNMLKWFKINAGVGYQIVTGLDQNYLNADGNPTEFFDSKDFNKPVFNLSFVFGGFGGKR
jgi:hypothetical protein